MWRGCTNAVIRSPTAAGCCAFARLGATSAAATAIGTIDRPGFIMTSGSCPAGRLGRREYRGKPLPRLFLSSRAPAYLHLSPPGALGGGIRMARARRHRLELDQRAGLEAPGKGAGHELIQII